MDTQPSPTEKTDDKVQALLAAGQSENPQSSRFSRRRFIQTGIAVSPLLMSVKSPASWGGGTNITNTSVAGQISGNASTTGGSTCIPKNPIDWCDIFDGNHHYGNWWDRFKDWGYIDFQSIKDALAICGIHSYTPFLGLFCNELSSWNSCRTQTYWKYKIVTSSCDNPTVHSSLLTNNFNILLRVQHNNSMISSGGYNGNQNNNFGSFGYNITSRDNNRCFDVNISDTNLHKYLTCGYLNGLLAPNVINYEYTQTDIVNGFMAAISHMAEDIAKHGPNYHPWANSPLSTLKDNLNRTWRNH